MSSRQQLMALFQQSRRFIFATSEIIFIYLSYTTGRGVEGLMRLTVRLKNRDERFEPAVNIIPVPDASGAKLDYGYQPVGNEAKYFEITFSLPNSLPVDRISRYQ